MTATISEYRVRSARSKLDFLFSEVDFWQHHHFKKQSYKYLQDLIIDVNQLFHDLLRLDSSLQEAYFDGFPYSEELSKSVQTLTLKWFHLGQLIKLNAGDSTDGLATLRKNLHEAEAFLSPSSEMGDYIDSLREKAAVEHKNEETLEGLVD